MCVCDVEFYCKKKRRRMSLLLSLSFLILMHPSSELIHRIFDGTDVLLCYKRVQCAIFFLSLDSVRSLARLPQSSDIFSKNEEYKLFQPFSFYSLIIGMRCIKSFNVSLKGFSCSRHDPHEGQTKNDF